jgi:hypothetical protein
VDSSHRVGLFINTNDILIVVGGALIVEEKTSKIAKIGADSGHSVTTSGDMVNPRVLLDSPHRVGLFTLQTVF